MASSLKNPFRIILRGACLIFIGSIVAKSCGYAFRLVIASLGPEEFGHFSICLTILSVASTFAFLGLANATKRFIPFYLGRDEPGKALGVIQSSFILCFVSSAIVSIFLLIGSGKISVLFLHAESTKHLVWLLSVILPFVVFHMLTAKSLMGLKNVGYRVVTYDIAPNVLKLIFVIIFVSFGWGAFGAISAYGVAIALSFMAGMYFLEKEFAVVSSPKVARLPTWELVSYSVPLMGAGIMGMVLAWTDTLMLGYFTTSREVGVYNSAYLISTLTLLGSDFLTPLFLPIISERFGAGRLDEIQDIYSKLVRYLFIVTVPILILFLVAPAGWLQFIFSSEYKEGGNVLVILMAGKVIYLFSICNMAILDMIKKTPVILMITIAAGVFNILANMLLIPAFGIEGAAWSTFISSIILSLLSAVYSKKMFNTHILPAGVIKIVSIGVFLTLPAWFLIKDKPFIVSVLIALFLSVIVYPFLLYLFKLVNYVDVYKGLKTLNPFNR